MKFTLVLAASYLIYFKSVSAIDSKWKLRTSVSGYELFTNCLTDVYDTLSREKRDIVVADGGRKLTDGFKDTIAKRGNNVVMFYSYSYMINNLQSFGRFLTRFDYSLVILSDRDDFNLMDFLNAIQHRHMYIVIAFYNNVSEDFLEAVMNKCLTGGLLHTVAIVNRMNSTQIVRGHFSTAASCKSANTLEKTEWSPGAAESLLDVFDAKKRINMKGCLLNISTIIIPPNVIRGRNLTDISGYETQMINVLGTDMNFTPSIRVHPYLEWGGMSGDSSTRGILGEVYNGSSEMAYGVIWPTHHRQKLFDLSITFENDCFGWAVPPGIAPFSFHRSLAGYLTDAFKIENWICILFSAICFCLLYVLHNVLLVRSERFTIFNACVSGFLVTVSCLVQRSVHKTYLLPQVSMKIVFITWLFYTQVIATIYNGILAERFVFPDADPSLNTIEELLASNLPLGTSDDVLFSINDIDANETLYNLVKERIQKVDIPSRHIIPKIAKGFQMAYCRNMGTLFYYRDLLWNDEDIHNNYHIMKDCFMTYPLVIALRKGSVLTHRTNVIISRLVEAGLPGHWKHRKHDVTSLAPAFQPEKVEKLRYIFYFYAIGMTLATITFVLEHLHYRFINRIKRFRHFEFVH